jgi:hypothetical protein
MQADGDVEGNRALAYAPFAGADGDDVFDLRKSG